MYNHQSSTSVDEQYHQGFLPQRNQRHLFYFDTSARCDLSNFNLSSENRRILKKTQDFSFQRVPITNFNYHLGLQKTLYSWIKNLGWKFPISSVKTIFTNHIFNSIYIWKNSQKQIVAYSICYFSKNISHIAYVFYDPQYSRSNLPIRLTLQVVIDSHQQGLQYCYLGRFDPQSKIGFYKRNLPGFQHFKDHQWQPYEKK